MATTVQNYLLIATAAGTVNGETVVVGQVVTTFVWDGVAVIHIPAGTETRADPTGLIQTGEIVTV